MFPYLDANRFTYAFIDSRGYGNSRHMNGDYTASEIASDAMSLAHELGWKRYHVVGHSMSGLTAQQMIVDANGAVKSACLLTPVPACGLQLPPEGKQMFRAASGNGQAKRGIIDFSPEAGSRLLGSTGWCNNVRQR